jgi:hypothetical protein
LSEASVAPGNLFTSCYLVAIPPHRRRSLRLIYDLPVRRVNSLRRLFAMEVRLQAECMVLRQPAAVRSELAD